MTDVDAAQWVESYRRAWESNDPDQIRALFTEEAEYFAEPFRPPWRGHEAIVAKWLARRDEPGDATFEWQPVSITEDVAVIQGTTVYADRTYSNLWMIRFDDSGRARHFTEWYMDHRSNSDDE